jgi:peptide deformylase
MLQRATKIEVQYQDLDGKAQQMQLRDFVARVFQHEYDHLQVRHLCFFASCQLVGGYGKAHSCC